jgi:hypothetical protein
MKLPSASVVEAMVTIAVAVLLTLAGFEMLTDVVNHPASVEANAGARGDA